MTRREELRFLIFAFGHSTFSNAYVKATKDIVLGYHQPVTRHKIQQMQFTYELLCRIELAICPPR